MEAGVTILLATPPGALALFALLLFFRQKGREGENPRGVPRGGGCRFFFREGGGKSHEKSRPS